MSDTILGGDITVYYLDENRQKRMEWTGSATGTRTMNEVYSAMGTLLDNAPQGDDATAFTAETPVEYTVGLIDANDIDPWYISLDCLEHIQGGALRTSGWTHTDGSATGIIIVPVDATGNDITTSEYGLDISGATTGNGTLLEILSDGGINDYLVIRPDTNVAGDNFTTDTQTITCNALTATQAQAGSNSGEIVWANAFNVTPIDVDTHVYVYRGLVGNATRARFASVNNNGQDFWPEGAFDRCFVLNDLSDSALSIIDAGNLTFFARKGNTLYDSFEITASTTSGGRNPVPLSASADLNNTTGYASFTLSGATGNFSVGDEIQGDTSGARAIITLVTNPGATPTLDFYYIGDPQTAFNGTEAITNNDDTGAATGSGAVSNAGPALSTWFTSNTAPTAVHANTTFDIDDDGTAEGYGIALDCNANPLTEVYEWTKYITRNGETSTTNTDGVEGEQYVGATVFLEYSGSVTGTISEGSDVVQTTTGATGVIISHDTTLKQILLRDTRGTFSTTDVITDSDAGGTVTPNVTAVTFNANKQAPFGSLAGGRFFGARGVLLTDYLSADENNFQLIDSQGTTKQRPIAITLSVSNLVGTDETTSTDDYVVSHRLTGAAGAIDKAEYSATGGEAIGDTTLVVDTSIAADVPGKTGGGVLNIRDASDNNKHYRIRFSSWTGSTFTLANIDIAAADASTDTTTIVESGAFTNAKRGDIVVNKTQGNAVSYVQTVDSANQVTIDPPITGQTTGDAIELNCIPVAVDTADDVYISLIDEFATSTSASVSIVYVSPINYRVKVSNVRNATKIRRFVTDDATSGTDRNVATIRNEDTIYT